MGVFILDKMLNDLKGKIPFGKKSKASDEDLDEEDSEQSARGDKTDSTDLDDVQDEAPEESSLIYKLKSKISALQKKSKNEDDDGEEDKSKKKPNAKKNSKVLQIVIGVGLVIFVLSDYIIPSGEETPEVSSSLKIPKRKKPNKVAPVIDPAATDPATTNETAATDVPATETPTDTAVTEPATELVTETPVEPSVEAPTVETQPVETAETPVETPTEPNIETAPSTDTGSMTSIDTIDDSKATGTEDNLTDQILQDLEKQAKGTQETKKKTEYVSPPSYDYTGRGLVYNCAGKHWACVDAPSYKTCEDNASSTEYLKKKSECHPFNVYESTRGCENMQNRMVSSSAKTEFCN